MAIWYAGSHSTDSGNNTGWVFTAPPGGGTLSIQLDDVGISASGSPTHNGTASVFLDNAVSSLSGALIHNGSASIQLDDAAISATGSENHIGSLSAQLDDASVLFDGTVIPPGPVSVVSRGGIDKHKQHKNFRNQKNETERDIQEAVNKVFGIEEPSEVELVEETVTETEIPDFSAQIERLALEAEAKALGQSIEQYQAMLDAERDDEEALLLLL